MKIFKVVLLIALACVAIPVGIVFTVLNAVYFTAKDLGRTVWRLLYNVFRSLSKIVSVCAAAFLTKTLTQQGVPFGTHSVSAVLGANQREQTLTDFGKWLVELLDSVETNHCRKASEKAGI